MKNILIVLTVIVSLNIYASDYVAKATDLIKSFETFSETPYRDVNKMAIGWGFNDKNLVARGRMSREEADRILNGYVVSIGGYIDTQVKVPLTDNQKSALVVFIYNVGRGNFSSSTLLKKLNNREYTAVASEIKRWNKVKKTDARGRIVKDKNGKVVYVVAPGLVKRRQAEANLWLSNK
jgi:lysozyme